ncbi:Syntaxin-11 [Nibea albiflora]|uniref:Syntaxin-11 n=1 Tax=Nibea albiflora TaxID=240163 RepID=A0ACB7FBD1_NIBAL|nr:Syntaxin-11 [Nibea albiflora]
MRDRLSNLQEMSNSHVEQMEYAESTASESFSNVDLEEELPHEAIVFDNSPALGEVFSQSQDIHREIQLIRLEYASLSNGFRDAMFDYNEAEMNHRDNIKSQIQRQMEIVGREVTGEEVEEMIETGQWNIFNDNLVSEGRMRDMLERLHTISEENDTDSEFCGPEYDEDKLTLSHEAVIFENSSEIDDILKEAHSLRKGDLPASVRGGTSEPHNERYATSVKRLTLLKKDSDSIAKRIQQRGEPYTPGLQALGEEKKQLEDKKVPTLLLVALPEFSMTTLMRAFHDVMGEYNEAEEMQRKTCPGEDPEAGLYNGGRNH